MRFRCFFVGTFRRQLAVSLIFLVVATVSAIGIASIQISQRVIRNHTARFGGKMLMQAAYRLGSVIDNAETTVDSLILDQRLAPLLHNLSTSDWQVHQTAQSALCDLLLQYKAALLPGAELIIVDSAGNTVASQELKLIAKSLIPMPHTNKSKTWRLRYFSESETGNALITGKLLELTVRIVSLPGQPQSGWIIMYMDYRIVESILSNISLLENVLNRSQSDVVVVGPEKQILYPWIAPANPVLAGAYQKLSGKLRNSVTLEKKVNGKNYLMIATPVPWTDWEVYIAAPTHRLYAGLERINSSIIMIGLICAISAVCFATLISFFVTKPVNRLLKTMAHVEKGHFSVRAPENGPLEIQTLGRAFNRMLYEVDRLTKRLVAEESERKTAVIKALQAQIAPHFLFNTLTALAGMTVKRPPTEVAEALRSLKRLLYLSMGKNGDFVTLADEFEHIHHYLYLMDIRYPGKFSNRMVLPQELRGCRVIRLVLQPIVENCLQHGLKSQGGLIRIVAVHEGGDVIIRITDDGVGMSHQQIEAVWQQDQTGSGVGVRNVDARLKLSFGLEYGLTLESVEGKGTTVSLRIPLQYGIKPENIQSGEVFLKELV
ncbi:MAG TPA: histidine kinase [Bacillota bacterium]|nr:histidine kinase [Bacillota bacterium]